MGGGGTFIFTRRSVLAYSFLFYTVPSALRILSLFKVFVICPLIGQLNQSDYSLQ